MKKDKLLSAVCLAGMLATLCACAGNESAAVGHPQIERSGAGTETELVLPEGIPVETDSTVKAYRLKVDLEKAKQEIERTFGITLTQPNLRGEYEGEDYTVTIDPDTGYWTYRKAESYSALEPCSDPISDAQALEIATRLIEDNGLWQGEVYNTVVTDMTTGGWNDEERIVGKDVYLYPSVEGSQVLGIFRLNISMDATGEIFSVYKLAADIGEAVSVAGKTRETLQEDLQTRNYSDSCSETLRAPKIEKGELAYYADAQKRNGAVYLYPVYVLTGEGTKRDGAQETFDVILDAQK